ncbi:hypothetical protein BPOR_1260g00030 [Botrytis porri]|uniref:Uncharacterized protein n=1 Tax=Botrytis porri TaxID=87229 RepID=A0A4Z1K6E6_9HELO|nr:hypothetical protein BPOR_1260g00030 [Botrytis porri]
MADDPAGNHQQRKYQCNQQDHAAIGAAIGAVVVDAGAGQSGSHGDDSILVTVLHARLPDTFILTGSTLLYQF